MNQKFGVVILAAGGSSRLGQPKQLLLHMGETLVEQATRRAVASAASAVIVVVGSHETEVRKPLEGIPVRIVVNQEWAEGMGSSIRAGIGALEPDIECAVIALCDQPRITSDLLRNLALRHFETGAPIVASSYDGVIGAPCAFAAELFPALLSLQGDSGARDLIRNSTSPVETVAFHGGNLDIDTVEDFRKLSGELE